MPSQKPGNVTPLWALGADRAFSAGRGTPNGAHVARDPQADHHHGRPHRGATARERTKSSGAACRAHSRDRPGQADPVKGQLEQSVRVPGGRPTDVEGGEERAHDDPRSGHQRPVARWNGMARTLIFFLAGQWGIPRVLKFNEGWRFASGADGLQRGLPWDSVSAGALNAPPTKRQTLREKGTQSHGTLRVSRTAELVVRGGRRTKASASPVVRVIWGDGVEWRSRRIALHFWGALGSSRSEALKVCHSRATPPGWTNDSKRRMARPALLIRAPQRSERARRSLTLSWSSPARSRSSSDSWLPHSSRVRLRTPEPLRRPPHRSRYVGTGRY